MRSLALAALLVLPPAVHAGDPPKLVTRTFQVVDLVTPIPDFTLPAGKTPAAAVKAQSTLDVGTKLVRTVTTIVKPDSWDGQGGAGKIEYADGGQMLVVNATPEVVKEVWELLEALRKLQDTNVVTEVRVISATPGFRDAAGVKCCDGALLSERELTALMEAAQGDRRVMVMQTPKVTTFDGQVATVRVGEEQQFVTGLDAVRVKGQTVFIGKNTPAHIGDAVTLCGRVGGDGKSVTLRVNLTRTQVAGKVDLVPVVTQMTPIFEGGSQGAPVPFTQYLQTPEFKTFTAERTATVPSCGTVVVGGWKETRSAEFGPPVVSKIPYMNRLFKNVGIEEREVVVLATTRVVNSGEAATRPVPAPPMAVHAPSVARPVTLPAPHEYAVRTQRLLYSAEGGPSPAAKQVQMDMAFAVVQADFMTKLGLPADATEGRVWTMTARERDMFAAALRNAPDRKMLSEPRILTQEGRPASVRVGGTSSVVTGLDVSMKDGNTVVVPKATSVDHGISARVLPMLAADGKSIRLHIAARQATNVEAPKTHPVVIPVAAEQGKPASAPLTFTLEDLPKQDIQSIDLAAEVPEAGTVVIGGIVGKTAGGKGTEVLIVLTPRVVTPVTTAGAKTSGPTIER